MKTANKIILIIFAMCFALFCTNIAEADVVKNKRIFVFDDATGVITEYDTKDFKVKKAIQIPKDLYFLKAKSDRISKGLNISASGNILYYDDEKHFDQRTFKRRLWFWDGKREYQTEISKKLNCLPTNDKCIVTDDFSKPYLDTNEAVFYWEIDHIAKLRQEPPDAEYPEIYITTDAEIYKVHFSNNGQLVEELIAKIPFNECKCSTGACSETCPTGHIITPKEGIKDFIEVEHFVQGQIGSSVEGYTYFEKKDGKWIKTDASKKLEKPFVKTDFDTGCCAWVNASSDLLFVIDGKKQKIIYDEYKRFNNPNYDISFHPVDAKLSPDFKRIAYTIAPSDWAMSDYKKDGTIRLSSDGKENPDELNRIKSLIKDIPMVEAVPVDKTSNITAIKNAELIGWIDNNRLLIFKNGKLALFTILTQQLNELPISAKSIEHVFLR